MSKNTAKPMKKYTLEEYLKEGERLFGKSMRFWKYICVSCGLSQSYNDFIEAGIKDPGDYVGFSCIGRWKEGIGCDWTLGGLLTIHTVEVTEDDGEQHARFDFDYSSKNISSNPKQE